MSKMEIGSANIRQIADEFAWRHFWLTHVMTETGGRHLEKIAQRTRHAKNDCQEDAGSYGIPG